MAQKTDGIRVDIGYYVAPAQLDRALEVMETIVRYGYPSA